MADDEVLVFIDEARRDLAYAQCLARERPSAFAHRQVVKAKERYDGCVSLWRCRLHQKESRSQFPALD